MKELIKVSDLPSTLDALELMEVKGGERKDNTGTTYFCLFTNAVKIECPNGGAVITCPQGGAIKQE